MMKKTVSILALLSLLLLCLPLTSCGGDEEITLYVYNWGEYISDGSDGTLDVNAAFEEKKDIVNGRAGIVGARTKKEIGMHAVRGGTIVGEHEVMFAGEDEIITISHSARSKRVFAVGAIRAAKFLNGKAAGRYEMKDLLAEEN